MSIADTMAGIAIGWGAAAWFMSREASLTVEQGLLFYACGAIFWFVFSAACFFGW